MSPSLQPAGQCLLPQFRAVHSSVELNTSTHVSTNRLSAVRLHSLLGEPKVPPVPNLSLTPSPPRSKSSARYFSSPSQPTSTPPLASLPTTILPTFKPPSVLPAQFPSLAIASPDIQFAYDGL
ncbi:MAG: hypothetical protein M1830_003055 [Pleopsidium flavum]|nr:MAG: hypothetical protein M1830_003055 [Pleopsidium flavum]